MRSAQSTHRGDFAAQRCSARTVNRSCKKEKERNSRHGTYVIVDGQRGILWAAHLAVFVALTEAVRARGVAELRCLRKELRGVLVVDKDDVVDAPLV